MRVDPRRCPARRRSNDSSFSGLPRRPPAAAHRMPPRTRAPELRSSPDTGARPPTPNTGTPGDDATPNIADTARPDPAHARRAAPATPRPSAPTPSAPTPPMRPRQRQRPRSPTGPTSRRSLRATPRTTPHPSPQSPRDLGMRTRHARPRRTAGVSVVPRIEGVGRWPRCAGHAAAPASCRVSFHETSLDLGRSVRQICTVSTR
jgi:hypothetical protein